eukprot:1156618-Pelagomonas_calceolata.AAC.2
MSTYPQDRPIRSGALYPKEMLQLAQLHMHWRLQSKQLTASLPGKRERKRKRNSYASSRHLKRKSRTGVILGTNNLTNPSPPQGLGPGTTSVSGGSQGGTVCLTMQNPQSPVLPGTPGRGQGDTRSLGPGFPLFLS